MTTQKFSLAEVQAALKAAQVDGWLLYDFRGSNALARRILHIPPDAHTTRRFAYFVPASGAPRKLTHRIEEGVLDHLPGEATVYLRWQEWEQGLASILSGVDSLAVEYSPRCANPYVSRVDAGTVELLTRLDISIVSSGDLVQRFEATWTDDQWAMHQQASQLVCDGFERAWQFIAERVAAAGGVRETEVQQHLMEFFGRSGLTTDHGPIVGCGPNSGKPHYAPQAGADRLIQQGDLVLVDAWAKLDRADAVYADYTQMGFVGSDVPAQFDDVFSVVAAARDAAIALVTTAFEQGRALEGWQVDPAARQVTDAPGYGAQFRHRLGHSIGQETHGNGANRDDLETHEQRSVMRRTCFSIEPGIYQEEFGVRSEVNVFVDEAGTVHVTGQRQASIRPLL
ncbi:MAG: aminopeptidase P family protein [Planctomycetales bacterium]|nr:aminopeptidase P family protein [Planctomycetales bacterium]